MGAAEHELGVPYVWGAEQPGVGPGAITVGGGSGTSQSARVGGTGPADNSTVSEYVSSGAADVNQSAREVATQIETYLAQSNLIRKVQAGTST